jgi:NAD(P)-dependent dehydrogenase (short-subunit alcohol dehydrogenase family)
MAWSPDRNALRGRVAVVAGATRGAGRGIAAALGEAGATVVCTGRTTGSTRSEYDRAETIEETAGLVTQLGGIGIAVAVDHLDHVRVNALAQKIRADHGRVDVLVNNIWGGELLKGGPAQWNTPIWKLDLDKGLRILRLLANPDDYR